jgi:hypothetical protein
MNNIKNKNGAISIFALLSVTFFVLFMLGAYKIVSSKNSQQLSSIQLMQQQYYVSDDKLYEWFADVSTRDPNAFVNQFTKVDYLHTEPKNNPPQYIDTNLSAPDGFKVVMKFQPDKLGEQFLMGAQDSGQGRSYVKVATDGSYLKFEVGVDGVWQFVQDSDSLRINIEVGKTYIISVCNVYNKNPDSYHPDFWNYFSFKLWNGDANIDRDAPIAEGDYTTYTGNRSLHKDRRSSSNLYLFSENHPDATQVNSKHFYGKMYYCKIYLPTDNFVGEGHNREPEFVLAREFIPYIVSIDGVDPENIITAIDIDGNPQTSGKPGMYNIGDHLDERYLLDASRKSTVGFYVNKGSGADFSYGND